MNGITYNPDTGEFFRKGVRCDSRYRELIRLLQEMHPHSQGYSELWAEAEAIKNRNGGKVPQDSISK